MTHPRILIPLIRSKLVVVGCVSCGIKFPDSRRHDDICSIYPSPSLFIYVPGLSSVCHKWTYWCVIQSHFQSERDNIWVKMGLSLPHLDIVIVILESTSKFCDVFAAKIVPRKWDLIKKLTSCNVVLHRRLSTYFLMFSKFLNLDSFIRQPAVEFLVFISIFVHSTHMDFDPTFRWLYEVTSWTQELTSVRSFHSPRWFED